MDTPSPLPWTRRPLTPSEKDVLRSRIERMLAASHRTTRVALPIGGAVIVALWIWTLLVSDAPRQVVTGFWLVVGAVIVLWVHRDLGRQAGQLQDMARRLESALRRDVADAYEVRARAYAELEEIEDEGASYVFELDGDRLALITGQEFYKGPRFPSLDFSLVYPLDEHGERVDMLIDRRGTKAQPARIIPAAVKQTLEVPEHLTVGSGTLADLERWMRPRSR